MDLSGLDLGFEPEGTWMIGQHNRQNARFAAAAALAMGIESEAIAASYLELYGRPSPSQRIAEIGGVTYVNDSKATRCVAAVRGRWSPSMAASTR